LKDYLDIEERPNKYGVPEIDAGDFVIPAYTDLADLLIGTGKKSATIRAAWKGLNVALKMGVKTCTGYAGWDFERYNCAQWELERYCDLCDLQGTLNPRLYFVSRLDKSGRVFGLEHGRTRY